MDCDDGNAVPWDGCTNGKLSEFMVNTTTVEDQFGPHVTALPDGRYVVVWNSAGQDGSGYAVIGRFVSLDGQMPGGEFQVNTYWNKDQLAPDVAPLDGGGFIVVWMSAGQDGSDAGIFGQVFSAAGEKVGGEFQVNQGTVGNQTEPSVATLPGSAFLVGWASATGDGNGYGAMVRSFADTGSPLGPEWVVNSFKTGDQRDIDVAALPGGFVASWSSAMQDGSAYAVAARLMDAAAVPVQDEVLVNTVSWNDQWLPAVAADADGHVAVVYMADGLGVWPAIALQLFTPALSKWGPETLVNTSTASVGVADVAFLPDHTFVSVWSRGQSGVDRNIFAQHFDADGNKTYY